jgi:tetratricopeptide (TPR) repeat protein
MLKKLFFFCIVSLLFFSCSNKTSKELYDEGMKQLNEGNIEDATETFNSVLEKDSCNCDVLLILSKIKKGIVEYSSSLKYLERYDKCGGNEETLCLAAGNLLETKIGNSQQAIVYYNRLLKTAKDSCYWLNYIGTLTYKSCSYKDAKAYLSRVKASGCINKENLACLKAVETDFTNFNNNEYKMSFEFPSEWKSSEKNSPSMFFFETVEKNSGVNFNLTIASDQKAPLSEWTKMITSETEKENCEILNNMLIEVNNQDCNYISTKRTNKSNTVIQNNYVFLKNGYAFMLNFTCPESIYENFTEVENRIIISVKVN